MKRSQLKRYKETVCLDCEDDQIRKTVAGRCVESPYHYNKHKQAEQRAKQSDKPVKVYVIPQVSKNQAKRNREYSKVNKVFKEENPLCQAKLSGCAYFASETHHKKGKVGDLLFDKDHFLAACRNCHDIIEENPDWAKENGFSVDRLY